MKIIAPLAGLAALTLAGSALAQAASPAAPPPLLNSMPELAAPKTLKVTSAEFTDGGVIPMEVSGYGASKSPSLKIAGAPQKTRSYTILMEDSDAQRDGMPILHWFVYNAPAAIPAGVPAGASLTEPVKLMQGPNVSGQAAYRGPHPPQPAKGPHHYHIEVYALDAELPAGLADRTALAAAMQGHVLAQGELVGQFTAPDAAAK